MRKNKLLLLLALLMTAATGAWAAEVTVTKTVHDLFPDVTNGTQKATLYSDDNLSISVNTDGNNGKVYSNGTEWRIYQTNSAVVTVTATDVTIKSVAFTFVVKNTGVIKYDGNAMTSGTAVNVNAASAQFVVGNSGAATNGQVIISGFTVVYETASSGGSGAGYTVSMKDGVKDADKWTVKVGEGQAQALPIGGLKGDGSETVTLQYNGRLKVKGVKATSDAAPAAPTGNSVDLSTLTADYEAQNGDVLTGTLNGSTQPYKITIADGATVTLDGVTINGNKNENYSWAGLNCLGDATIILKDDTENTVKGFYEDYPGIHVPSGSTLTIKGGTQGTGKLTASPFDGGTYYSYGAGIGGVYKKACGNIDIQGGVITAKGGYGSAGIGSALNGSCGNITIASTVTKVTATKGSGAPYSIGAVSNSSCGTVTIGGTVYWQNNAPVNGGNTYLATSPLIWPSN